MKQRKFTKHHEKWRQMANLWSKFTKPGRPSKDDLRNYHKLIEISLKNIALPSIVLLGATPELRDLLFKFGERKIKISCVDMTKDMYKAMNKFVKYRNKRERFIKSNWLEMSKKIKNESVDLVIGDFVIGNVGGYEEKFFREIKKILKPPGNFITRAHYLSKKTRRINDFYKELKRLSKMVADKKLLFQEASSYFANNLLFYTGQEEKEHKVSLSFLGEQIRLLENQIKLNGNIYEKMVLNTFKNSWWKIKDKYWTNYKKSIIERIIKKHFKVRKILFSKDYEIAGISPIYLLKNK